MCGFVGSTLAHALIESGLDATLVGIDNFIRPGSELNREKLRARGVRLVHGDIRAASDLETLAPVDWIIDAAANPSVLAGVDGLTSSRQLVEHNLGGTVNILELAKRHHAGVVLLSTSRVYSIAPLAALPVEEKNGAYQPRSDADLPAGLSADGIAENFSTAPPVSLYGSTKIASEVLALEYGAAFGFPVWINRCGVLAGAGQFGRADQGIFAFWINAYLRQRPLTFIGMGGTGYQTRDALHPRDLAPVLVQQMQTSPDAKPSIVNLGGGNGNAMSLAQLSDWCGARFGRREIARETTPRPFDLPWVVMDCGRAREAWEWQPQTSLDSILNEIAAHAEQHPEWLDVSAPL